MRFIVASILLISASAFGQYSQYSIDSMQLEVDKYPNYDTAKISRMLVLAEMLNDEDKELKLSKTAYKQSKAIKDYRLIAKSSKFLGTVYYFLGDYERSERYMTEAVEVSRSHLKKTDLAHALMDLGQIQDMLENDEMSLRNTLEAVKILEDSKEYMKLAQAYINLGTFYYYRDKTENALEYYKKAKNLILFHAETKEDRQLRATIESHIGWCYYYLEDISSAIEQMIKAVEFHSKYDYYSPSSADARANLASLYVETKDFDLARIHAKDALDISIEEQYPAGENYAYQVLGEIEYGAKNYEKAVEYHLKSLEIAEQINDLYQQSEITNEISRAYHELGKYKLAYLFLEKSKVFADSISQIEANAAFEDAMTKYETEKKEAENTLLQQESKLKSLQIEQERQEAKAEQERQWLIGGGIGLVLLTSLFFMVNRVRLKTRTNKQLAKQRDEIAEQKREITDSINYAKRIQDSFLPSESDFEECFNDYFLMYRPKDIVAGDFYILEEVDDYIYFSVADCTGHGVPGAMVSLVCNNAIRKVLHEINERDPGKILDKAREIVIDQFARKGHSVKDGMDLSFCRLDKKNMKLSWAGANNSVIIIRAQNGAMHEIKPNKQPIGRYISHDPFTSHEIDLFEGDQIYMTSDGYPDQFGGEKGKKYKQKRFKDFLLEISNEDLGKQKELITAEFDAWKEGFEQIDDVCVMGVKI